MGKLMRWQFHTTGTESSSSWKRPYNFWQWESYGVSLTMSMQSAFTDSVTPLKTYIEFVGALIAVNTVLYFVLGWTNFYVEAIGLIALGLESIVSYASGKLSLIAVAKVCSFPHYSCLYRNCCQIIKESHCPAFE